MTRLAALAIAAALVLGGCGAPDYGGRDSDASTWPKSDKTSTATPKASGRPKVKATPTKGASRPSKAPMPRLPDTLAGEPLEPRSRAMDDVVPELVGDISGLDWDGGVYGRPGTPSALGLIAYTGKSRDLGAIAQTLHVGGVDSVGRSSCGTYQGPNAVRVCWRSSGRRLVQVLGVVGQSDERLARAVDEALTYLARRS